MIFAWFEQMAYPSKHGFCWPLLIEDEETGRVVEVSRLINQWWAVQAHEIDQAPLFNVAHPTKSSRHGIKPRRKKLTQDKSGKSGADSDEKQRNSNVEKLTRVKIREIAGKFEIGNYLELRWWKIGSRLHFKSWLAPPPKRGGWLVGGTEINEGIQINITSSFSN